MKKIMYFIIWGVSLFVLTQTTLPAIHTIQKQQDINREINLIENYKCTFPTNEIIDQNQSSTSGNSIQLSNSSIYYAQRFQPQLNILTKISLLISKPNQLSDHTEFTISLRKYFHSTIAKKVVNIDNVTENATWIYCDFGYIHLIQNESYYIVCHVANASKDNYIEWYFGINNPYTNGKPYYAIDDTDWKEFTKGVEFPNLDFCFKTIGFQNQIPQIPSKPNGPTSGQYGKEYSFTSRTNDSNLDNIYFKWNWGDGEESEWLGPFQSGSICEASHIWMIKGSYLIKVKAKDVYDFESDWSEPLTIRMEKSKIFSQIIFLLAYYFNIHVLSF